MAEDNVSTPSSFVANAHNELYAFYTNRGEILKKKIQANRWLLTLSVRRKAAQLK